MIRVSKSGQLKGCNLFTTPSTKTRGPQVYGSPAVPSSKVRTPCQPVISDDGVSNTFAPSGKRHFGNLTCPTRGNATESKNKPIPYSECGWPQRKSLFSSPLRSKGRPTLTVSTSTLLCLQSL